MVTTATLAAQPCPATLPTSVWVTLGVGIGSIVAAGMNATGYAPALAVCLILLPCLMVILTGLVEGRKKVEKLTTPHVEAPVRAAPSLPAAPEAPTRLRRLLGTDAVVEADPILERMVLLQGTETWIGSPKDVGRANEHPRHKVRLSPFRIACTPVTVGQWNGIMEEKKEGEPGQPATGLSWDDAVRFCNAASARAGLKPCYIWGEESWSWDRTADGYRLPTESEWEHAARAGTETPWFHGSSPDGLDRYAWVGEGPSASPHEVAKKKPNPWGLYDMLGNVWEWCWDAYLSGAYRERASGVPRDPVQDLPPFLAGRFRETWRVWRGGSAAGNPADTRPAARDGFSPDFKGKDLGFRCVRGKPRI